MDESTNDPTTFWHYVIAALSALQPIPPQVPALLRASQSGVLSSALILLCNALSASARDIFLVLDDYHLIQTAEIHRTLAFFLESLPTQVHLILSGRTDPPLPLSSLRASGRLLEIRGEDLRLVPEEVQMFLLNQPALRLSDETISLLGKRTEGWIAGLHLAVLSLRDREDSATFVRDFSGQDRYILDYLVDEVLLCQPEHIQLFLLQPSILQSLCSSLCDAICQNTNSQEILETLEKSNAFVVALDHQRHWYRYHQLFAETLRRRLQQEAPELITQLHLRAAKWYEQQQMSNAAINFDNTHGPDNHYTYGTTYAYFCIPTLG